MALRSAFKELVVPGLKSIFWNQLKTTKSVYTMWINVETSKRAYEEEYKLTGLGQMIQKAEGAVYTFDEPIGGDTVRYTHLTYGLGFRVTEEMIEDDLYGVMNRMSKELGKSAQYNKDVQAASVLNNAFDSTYAGFDGLELCSTAHTDLGTANTQANEPATAADLALTSLQAAIEAFEGWTDDRGFMVDVEPRKLIHAAGDIWTAGEILETEQVPDSADNAKNIVKSKYGIVPMHLKFLTDADAWFLTGDKGDHDMKIFIRKDNQFRDSDDPLTGDMLFTARHRLSTGFGDWRGVYGSPGA